ncbi:MAG: hypothetical protein VX554_00520, partial [Candidatus Thermoplasmatota archaeon]|nr:hypothetical protein [Candidatus Thermoplasmatota archaeon]
MQKLAEARRRLEEAEAEAEAEARAAAVEVDVGAVVPVVAAVAAAAEEPEAAIEPPPAQDTIQDKYELEAEYERAWTRASVSPPPPVPRGIQSTVPADQGQTEITPPPPEAYTPPAPKPTPRMPAPKLRKPGVEPTTEELLRQLATLRRELGEVKAAQISVPLTPNNEPKWGSSSGLNAQRASSTWGQKDPPPKDPPPKDPPAKGPNVSWDSAGPTAAAQQDDPDAGGANALLAFLKSQKKDGESTGEMRLGNWIQKMPRLSPPESRMEQRLFQVSEWLRGCRKFVAGTLLTDSAGSLWDKLIEESLQLHKAYVRMDEASQDDFCLAHYATEPTYASKTEKRYFKILPGMIYSNVPEQVQQECVMFDRERPEGWLDLLAIMIAIRRAYDVNTPKHVEFLELTARKATGDTYDDLRRWSITADAALELGHVSSMQVGQGLLKLADRWENTSVILPREVRELSSLIVETKLTKFGVTLEAVQKVTRRMLRLVKETTSKGPVKKKGFGAIADVLAQLGS